MGKTNSFQGDDKAMAFNTYSCDLISYLKKEIAAIGGKYKSNNNVCGLALHVENKRYIAIFVERTNMQIGYYYQRSTSRAVDLPGSVWKISARVFQ